MNKFLRIVFLLALVCVGINANAQNSREYIRNAISNWGECKNVAITKTNGDLALYGKNGYSFSECPSDLCDRIKQLNSDGNTIQDVCLSENGSWIILYDNNGGWWNGIPGDMADKFKTYYRNGEIITSVSFTDQGEWIIITDQHIAASSSTLKNWLFEGCNDYGELWSCCITEDGAVAVYASGYRFRGNVPEDFKDALREADFDVYRAKFAGTSWFMADKDGTYRYHM